jgi:hypothetical protein
VKTYTLEIDGKPAVAFRATDDEHAAQRLAEGSLWLERPDGVLTVRPATVEERQKWTWASVPDEGDEYETDSEYEPDTLLVPLETDEEEQALGLAHSGASGFGSLPLVPVREPKFQSHV